MRTRQTGDGRLVLAFARFSKTPVPKLGPHANDDLAHAQVAMAGDEAHLAGLVDRYIRYREIVVPTIAIDQYADEVLARVARDHPDDEDVHEFLEYRRMMLELAEMLSEETGVPIERYLAKRAPAK